MKHLIASLAALGCLSFAVAGKVNAHSATDGFHEGDEFGPWSAPINLGPIVNSNAVEAGPDISRDGLSLYFHSTRSTPVTIYVSHRAAVDLPWEAPVSLAATLNTAVADAGPRLSWNGHLMFFGSLHAGSFDIYVSRRKSVGDDFAWETPLALPSTINGSSFDVPSDYVEGREGGAQLFFASDRANGQGQPGLDIYMSELRRNGTWGDPVYVSELNSGFADDRPALRADGLEVIFNSDRDGNHDLFVSRRRHVWEAWSAPENLGPVLNSTAGDIHPALSANGRTLYFASTRSGNFDLYASTRSMLHSHE